MEQLIYILAATGEEAHLRHIGIHGNGGKPGICQVGVGLHFGISEAHDRKAGLVFIQAVLADIIDPLRHAAILTAPSRVIIGLCEISVFIQGLAMPDRDSLPGLCRYTQLRISRQVLSKVDDRFPIGCFDEPAGKALLLQNRNTCCRGQLVIAEIADSHSMPAVQFFHPGVIAFTHLQVVFPDGALLRGFPAFIAAQDGRAVRFQLTQQRQIIAIVIPQAVDANASPVPAVAQNNKQLIFTGFQQLGHIVALHHQPLFVIPGAWSQHKIAHPLSVQVSSIQAVAGNIQACAAGRFCGEPSAQIGSGLLLFRFMGQFRVDPFCLPGRHDSISDHPIKTSHGTVPCSASIQLNRL